MAGISKLITTIAALSLSNVALSAPSFSGFYAGGGIGVNQNSWSANSSASANHFNIVPFSARLFPGTSTIVNSVDSKHSASAISGALSLGYALQGASSPWYLGAEASLDLTANRGIKVSKSSSIEYASTFRYSGFPQELDILSSSTKASYSNPAYALDLRPGLVAWVESLIYGRVGVGFTRMNLRTNNILNITYPAAAFADPMFELNNSMHKSLAGLRLGLGAERHINNHLSWFVDYVHTSYGNTKLHGIGEINQTLTGLRVPVSSFGSFLSQSKVRLSTNQVLLGFRYYFA